MAQNTVPIPAGASIGDPTQPQGIQASSQSQGNVPIPDGASIGDPSQQHAQDLAANDARPWWRKALGLAPDATTPEAKAAQDADLADQQQRATTAAKDSYQSMADPLVGVAKAVPRGLLDIDNNIVRPALNKLGAHYDKVDPTDFGASDPHVLDNTNKAQAAGGLIENILEFAYGEGELKTAGLGAKALSASEKFAGMGKMAKFLEENPKLATLLGSAIRNGTVSGAQTMVHTGDTGDALKSAVIGGTLGGTLEGASGAIEKGLANRAAASGVQDAANEFSVPLSAGQSTTGAVTQATEAALKKVPFVNAPFNKLGAAQNDAIKSAADEIANSIGSKAASGTAAGEDIQNAIGEAKNTAGKAYADAQQQISDAGAAQLPVPLKGTISDTAQKLLDNIQLPDEFSAGVKDVQGRQAAVDVLKNLAKDTAEDGTPRSMTWEQARRLKSQLFDLANSGESNIGKGAVKQMTSALDQSMQDTLAGSGKTDLAQQFSQASNHYRAVNDAMDTSFIKKMMNRDPIDVGKYLLDNTTPNAVQTVKTLAGSQMPQVQRGIFEEMFNRALNNPDGIVAGKVLQKEFQKLGPETAQAVFNPAQYSQIQRFVDLVGKVGLAPKAGSTTAGAGAEAALAGWHIVHGGLLLGSIKTGGTLLGARGISKLMTTPGGISLMTKALTASQKGANSQAARQAIIGLMNYATSQHMNDLQNQ